MGIEYLNSFKAPYVFSIAENGQFVESIQSEGLEKPNDLTFPIYSLSKTFTSVLVLKSFELGKLSLEDSLGKYIPDLPAEFLKELKIKNLLTHRSGLADYTQCEGYTSRLKNEPSIKVDKNFLIEMVLDQGQKFAEEKGFHYANIGYLFLERVLGAIHSRSFESLVESEICAKLGLENSRLATDLSDLKRLTFPCLNSASIGGIDMRGAYHPHWVSHALITSSIIDLSRFFAAVFQGDFLQSSFKSLLTSPIAVNRPSRIIDAYYGYGIMGDPNSKIGSFLGHDGGGPGYSISAYHQELNGRKRDYFLVFGKEAIESRDVLTELVSQLREC